MISTTTPIAARAERTARLLAALANPQRLLILCHLSRHGETGAGELARRFGFSQSALSQHLARMRAEALITQRRQGRALFYDLNEQLDLHLPVLLDGLCEPGAAAAPAAAAVELALSAASGPTTDAAAQPVAIQSAGAIHPMSQAAYQPDPDATYKVVFAISRANDAPARLHPALERVARTVNLYANAGAAPAHLQFVASVSGPAIAIALDEAHYRAQFGVANPNLPVLRDLRRHGVDVAVCGQALAAHQYDSDMLDPAITVALSALTTITSLQQQGYALMPL